MHNRAHSIVNSQEMAMVTISIIKTWHHLWLQLSHNLMNIKHL